MKVSKIDAGILVRVNAHEALRIINTLTRQLLSGHVNGDRDEFTDQNGEYFSIAVADTSLPTQEGDVAYREKLHEAYPKDWQHATIHLNPKTGEMHSDGDHRVREWLQEKIKKA